MAERKATMMDVASRAGVSQATVSLVLNNIEGARLSQATKDRVLEVSRELGYRLVKRGPRRDAGEKTVIGMIVDDIATDPWMAIAFDAVCEKAWESGLSASLIVHHGDREMAEQAFQTLSRLPLIGVIYGTILTRLVQPPEALFGLPSVLLNCFDAKRSLPSVIPSDMLGGRTATERLLEAGHRRIGMINGQSGLDASNDRLRGYSQALTSHDVAFDPEMVLPGNWEPSSGYEGTRALMALPNRPTAIFCANDMMAVGCFEALHEMGLSIPNDVSVIGFDDREIAQFTRPPLTTLLLPHAEMGATAAEYLIDHAARRQVRPLQIKVDCTLVERGSIAPPKAGRF